MKLKELFYFLGLKPRPQVFGSELRHFDLPTEGRVEAAQWLAPSAVDMRPDQSWVDRLREVLRPGDVVLDIGAHGGDTALPLALAVGPTGAVLALEPNPYVFPVLERNATLNRDKTRIIPLHFAAMREDGEYEFQYGSPAFDNGGYHEGMPWWMHGSAFTVKVPGHNTNEYLRRHHADLLPRLRYIKVDVEGFDLAVLQTLEPIIQEFRPYLQVEVFSQKRSLPGYREQLLGFLRDHGYELRKLEQGPLSAGTPITAENMMQWNAYDVFCTPRPRTT